MEKFTSHTGVAMPLKRSNVDTDQIIPAVYLKRVTRTGFEDGLFAAWRNDPEFVLNRPEYADASILVAGPDFGTGSSREHAVWALQNYGFKVVISSRFADIFRGNSGKAGLLAAQVDEKVVQKLWDFLEDHPGATISVDLESRTVKAGDGPDAIEDSFDIDDYTRWRLLEGLDDIGITLGHDDVISAYESTRPLWKPTTRVVVDVEGVLDRVGPSPRRFTVRLSRSTLIVAPGWSSRKSQSFCTTFSSTCAARSPPPSPGCRGRCRRTAREITTSKP